MKNPCEIFASVLKCRRTDLGMTQRELGEAMGYSEKTVSKWESGGVIAPSVVLPKLAAVLKTDINSFFSERADEVYYLGVDGGGTKTDFALSDSDGRVIAHVSLEGCNPNDVGLKNATDIISRGISLVCADIPTSKIYAFFGIAGGTTGDMCERISVFLDKFGFAAYGNGNDADNALSVALGEENGTVVIIGTGSVAFSRVDGVLHRRGGFGYLFEDGGSGFSIGRDALMHALTTEECGSDTVLAECVRKIADGNIIPYLSELYKGGKRKIASFAPAVFEAFRAHDPVAEEIINRNMAAIARLIESSPITDPLREKQRVYVVGGLVGELDIILPFINHNLSCPEKYEITAVSTPPYVGALKLAERIKEKKC